MAIRWFPLLAVLALPAAAQEWEDEERIREFREHLAPQHTRYLEERGHVTDHLRLNGSARAEQWYDNNVLLTPKERERDVVTRWITNLRTTYERRGLHVDGEYENRYHDYADNDDFDDMEHFAKGKIRYKAVSFQVEAWDEYSKRNEPYELVIFSDRVERVQNDFGGSFRLIFDQAVVEVIAAHRALDIRDESLEFFAHERSQFVVLAGRQVTDKVAVVGEAGFGTTEFDVEGILDDFDQRWYMLGTRINLTYLLKLTVRAGWAEIDADEESGSEPGEDQAGPVARAEMTWRASIPGIVVLDFQHFPVESPFTGFSIYSRLRLTYSHWIAERWSAQVNLYTEQSEPEGDERGRSIGLTGLVKYEIGRNFVLEAGVEFRRVWEVGVDERFENLRGLVRFGVEW